MKFELYQYICIFKNRANKYIKIIKKILNSENNSEAEENGEEEQQ